ncbi:MAG: hypothetical protein ACKOMX_09870, partial [Actinomycetota bacterium]
MRERTYIAMATAAVMAGAILTAAPPAFAKQPGFAALYNTRIAVNTNTTVYAMGNDLNNVKSLVFTCSDSKAT